MSWPTLAQIRARIADYQAIRRPLTPAELRELERLDHNYRQRQRRLTDQLHRAQARAARLQAELQGKQA